jgi:hypothetical protein
MADTLLFESRKEENKDCSIQTSPVQTVLMAESSEWVGWNFDTTAEAPAL